MGPGCCGLAEGLSLLAGKSKPQQGEARPGEPMLVDLTRLLCFQGVQQNSHGNG
jgi:hypothetical protein